MAPPPRTENQKDPGFAKPCKIIAWLQIVVSPVMLIREIVVYNQLSREQLQKMDGRIQLVLIILEALLGFVMGVVLLIGTTQERVSYLTAWLILTAVYILLSGVPIVLVLIGGGEFDPAMALGLFTIFIKILITCVVNCRRNEIKKDVAIAPVTLDLMQAEI